MRGQRIDRFLEDEAWPQIPDGVLGRPISKTDREAYAVARLAGEPLLCLGDDLPTTDLELA